MAFNPYIGWTLAELQSALRQAQNDLAAGKTVTKAGDGNVMVMNQVDTRPETRIRLLLLALNKLDPVNYEISSITPITVAKVSFGSGSATPTQ